MATKGSPLGFAGLFLKHRRKPWPGWVPTIYGERPPERVGKGRIRYTFINHATVLIQTDSCNILTDPIWSKRCSPLSWAGPKRHRNPGIRFEDLPPIDLVLISHNHYDHMDLPTLRRLAAFSNPLIVAGSGNQAFLQRMGLTNSRELEWWESLNPGDLRITFVPARHFSGRSFFDGNKTLWGGFIVESSAGSIYFAGDTGYGDHFQEIRKRFGPQDLSFLPIGAYEPRSFMCAVHMNPAEAVKAHQDLDSVRSVGIHFGTFRLAFEGIDDPEKELVAAREQCHLSSADFLVPQFGLATEISLSRPVMLGAD